MRILSSHIFSKSFGGKIQNIWTDVTYRDCNFKKNNLAHAYFERPYFSKFFGGKIENV